MKRQNSAFPIVETTEVWGLGFSKSPCPKFGNLTSEHHCGMLFRHPPISSLHRTNPQVASREPCETVHIFSINRVIGWSASNPAGEVLIDRESPETCCMKPKPVP